MRNVSTIKEERDHLRNLISQCIDKKKEILATCQREADGSTKIGSYDSKVLAYLDRGINLIRCQINALEFVLNEDTELIDYLDDSFLHREYGINKSTVFEEGDGDNE